MNRREANTTEAPAEAPPASRALAQFEQLRPRLFGVAYGLLGSVAEAEDVVQDAWIRLQRKFMPCKQRQERTLMPRESQQEGTSLPREPRQTGGDVSGIDETWDLVRKHYDDEQIAALVAMCAQINAWNRINVTLRTPAGFYDPATKTARYKDLAK